MPRALLDAGTLRFNMELHCFLWKRHSLMRPLEGLVEAESSAGHQRKAWKGKGKSKKDRKVSLKEKNTFSFTGAASGLLRVEEGSKVCLEADNPTSCTLCAPVSNHPGVFQCLVGLGSTRWVGLMVLKGGTGLIPELRECSRNGQHLQ